jgi:hypothetical protein
MLEQQRSSAWSTNIKGTYQIAINLWTTTILNLGGGAMCTSLSIEVIENVITAYACVSCGISQLSPYCIQATYLPGVAATLDMERAPSKDLFRQAMNGKEVKLVMAGLPSGLAIK